MSKPDDIPEGVWAAACEAFDADINHGPEGVEPQEVIARAIMAERERCAKVAFKAIGAHRPDASFDDSQAGTMERNALLCNVADETAAAIRGSHQ